MWVVIEIKKLRSGGPVEENHVAHVQTLDEAMFLVEENRLIDLDYPEYRFGYRVEFVEESDFCPICGKPVRT